MNESAAELRAARAERWRRASGAWLFASAIVLAVVFALWVMWQDPPPPVDTVVELVIVATYVPFVVDFGVRLWLAEHRVRFLLSHPLDLLVLLVPVLRPLLVVLGLLVVGRGLLAGRRQLAGRFLLFAVSVSALLCLVAGSLVVVAERNEPGATLTTPADGLWWAIVTVTTVGYGDEVPVTDAGRLIGVVTMMIGIGLVGSVTATLSSALVLATTEEAEESDESAEAEDAGPGEQVSPTPRQTSSPASAELALVLAELRTLRAEVGSLRERLEQH